MSTWRQVAEALARQLEAHANNCSEHPNQDQPEDCPFCKDTAAWNLYRAKQGPRDQPPAKPQAAIPFYEIAKERVDQ